MCARPIPQRTGPGRPRDFCDDLCGQFWWSLERVERALVAIEPRLSGDGRKLLRSRIVAELLNHIPPDVSAQPRDRRGRWRA